VDNFALRSRRVLSPEGEVEATLVIRDGLIASLLPYDEDCDCPIEDLGDLVLMPGLVDSHVHINEPGRTDWEGFETATQAAAAGGITTLVDMPLNCIPVTTSRAALDEKLEAVKGKLWVDCGFWGGVVPDSIEDLDELLDAGVMGVKSFLIDSGIDEFPHVNREELRRAMPIVAKHGVPYLIHAELQNEDGVDSAINNYADFLESRPSSWETDAIDLMISEMSACDCHMHIVHLSTSQALESIKIARSKGIKLTVETCPHYLTLAAESITALDSGNTNLYKCCPPIREDKNREQLWQALKEGLIDFIVSDHSPCTADLKLLDTDNLDGAWGGIAALQFGLPLIWTEARLQGFDLLEVNRLMSASTADFIGLGEVKGKLRQGYAADILVFNDAVEYPISPEMIRHKNKFTPYIGKQVRGRVERTYLRGQLVFSDDKFQGVPSGRPILKGKDGY